MRVLVTGAKGMLGRAIAGEFVRRGDETVALGRTDLDVTSRSEVKEAIGLHSPDVVVQCAAYTAVDGAESETEEAFRINAAATAIMAEECQRIGAVFVYPSTDYVFSGETRRPWKPDDLPSPVNAYGRSKLAGERAALSCTRSLVVRTSWLFGSGGANFVDRITELARERDEIDVVSDQVGLPTWSEWLAETIADLVQADASGTFHATGGGEPASWFDFAAEIVERQGLPAKLRPVSSTEFVRPAKRPGYSVLDCSETESLLRREVPSWRAMLQQYLQSRSPAEVRN